ncbi:MAG: hypothetical protein J0L84_18650 [Verrucomicrobia bacterium]|nr:hypothetical protein [Verrucomicrobiota bacterium]
MTDLERQQIRERIAQWDAAAPVMQALRDEEVRRTDTAQGIHQLAGLAALTLRDQPPRSESGLVEQQAWFARLRAYERNR